MDADSDRHNSWYLTKPAKWIPPLRKADGWRLSLDGLPAQAQGPCFAIQPAKSLKENRTWFRALAPSLPPTAIPIKTAAPSPGLPFQHHLSPLLACRRSLLLRVVFFATRSFLDRTDGRQPLIRPKKSHLLAPHNPTGTNFPA